MREMKRAFLCGNMRDSTSIRPEKSVRFGFGRVCASNGTNAMLAGNASSQLPAACAERGCREVLLGRHDGIIVI